MHPHPDQRKNPGGVAGGFALVGSRRRRTNTADLVEVAFGTEMVRGERRQWVVRTTGLLAG